MSRRAFFLLAALAAIAVIAARYLDGSAAPAIGIVDAGVCGFMSYSYTAAGVAGLAHIDEAYFYSTGPGHVVNAVSLQLNVFARSGGIWYWVQNVFLITYINGTYYLTVADYIFNATDYGLVEARGSGNIVVYQMDGRRIAFYQSSATVGEVKPPVDLGLVISANGSALYFYYEVDGQRRLYDVVYLPGELELYVGPGRELEWIVAGPREGYTAVVTGWRGWMELYYEAGGGWYAPPCAYSGSESPSTAERISPVRGLAEYAEGDRVVQTSGRSSIYLLWSPRAVAAPMAGGIYVSLTPPEGRWIVLVNGTEAGQGYIALRPGVYNVTAVLKAGDFTVYRRYIYVKISP